MCFPFTFRNLKIRKCCFKGRLFRTVHITPEYNLACAFPHMENPHLLKIHPIPTTFNKVIHVAKKLCKPKGNPCQEFTNPLVCEYRPVESDRLLQSFLSPRQTGSFTDKVIMRKSGLPSTHQGTLSSR